ncbi:MAG TPA: RNA polymerase sigma factor SigJ [Solirubrobacter sp.]|nr:RNA polymerase sigma factor SigJ [Solirubrobacter sp.]
MRPLLFSIAYRMLGSVTEAEDVVQEAYLRRAAVSEPVENERAFMTTVTTRLAIDVLRSARARRETYVGDWLPEPLVEAEAPDAAEAEDSVSLAMLVLLERLSPVERAVFVLRESFDVPFADVAAIVDRSEANCRQILARARRRVESGRPRFDADPAERRALVARFLAAAREGDLDGLVALLAPDAVLIGDGGGVARALAHPLTGAPAVARAAVAFYGQVGRWGVTTEPVRVNGGAGFRLLDAGGRIVGVVDVEVADGRIAAIHSIVNPGKLAHLGETSDLALRPSVSRSARPRSR